MKTKRLHLTYGNLLAVLFLVLSLVQYSPVQAADNSQLFPETGKTVSGKFLRTGEPTVD